MYVKIPTKVFNKKKYLESQNEHYLGFYQQVFVYFLIKHAIINSIIKNNKQSRLLRHLCLNFS